MTFPPTIKIEHDWDEVVLDRKIPRAGTRYEFRERAKGGIPPHIENRRHTRPRACRIHHNTIRLALNLR